MKWIILIVFALATGCAGGGYHQHRPQPRTRLTVVVYRGHSVRRFTLTCAAPGGTAPDPARACRAFEDFVRRGRRRRVAHTCLCALYIDRIVLGGVLDGRRLAAPVEVSGCAACGMGSRAAADVAQAFAAMHLRAG